MSNLRTPPGNRSEYLLPPVAKLSARCSPCQRHRETPPDLIRKILRNSSRPHLPDEDGGFGGVAFGIAGDDVMGTRAERPHERHVGWRAAQRAVVDAPLDRGLRGCGRSK